MQTAEPRPQEALQLRPLDLWSAALWLLCHREAQMEGHVGREANSLTIPAGSSPQLTFHE